MRISNLKRLYSRQEIHGFIFHNWKTKLFRDLHAEGFKSGSFGQPVNFVTKIVEDFAKLPRFTFEMTSPELEWAHFSTWWGGIPSREYDNPYIHDLYWIHEMSHAGNMVYVPGMNLENFTRKMTDNELHASVVSEVQVYFEIPQLRNESFKHEIYADRFLDDDDFADRYKADPLLGFEEMKVRRRDTMMDPNPKNIADFWIHRFYTQNAAWAACWAQNYNKVETAMANLRNMILNPAKLNVGRQEAFDSFLDDFLKANTKTSIPFLREAEAFSGVYWANRGHYDDAMKKGTK